MMWPIIIAVASVVSVIFFLVAMYFNFKSLNVEKKQKVKGGTIPPEEFMLLELELISFLNKKRYASLYRFEKDYGYSKLSNSISDEENLNISDPNSNSKIMEHPYVCH